VKSQSDSTKIIKKIRENRNLKELTIALMLFQYVILIWKIERTDGSENESNSHSIYTYLCLHRPLLIFSLSPTTEKGRDRGDLLLL